MKNRTSTNQSVAQRVFMLFASLGMIAATLSTAEPLGWRVIIPLLAIYPGLSAFIGWDPLTSVMAVLRKRNVGIRGPIWASA